MVEQTRKLNVMQIILNLDIGGAQEVVRMLVEYLASDDCLPVVCSVKDGPLRQDIERLGIRSGAGSGDGPGSKATCYSELWRSEAGR